MNIQQELIEIVASAAERLGIDIMLIGAFARDYWSVKFNLFPTFLKPLKWAENLQNNYRQCRILTPRSDIFLPFSLTVMVLKSGGLVRVARGGRLLPEQF